MVSGFAAAKQKTENGVSGGSLVKLPIVARKDYLGTVTASELMS